MNDKVKLSEDAWNLLITLELGIGYIPKKSVEEQWSPESRAAFHELLQAGMIEEISMYRLKEGYDISSLKRESEATKERIRSWD